VARGDTLWDLTKQALRATGRSTSNANVASHVAKLYQANRATIGSDPNLILVGATIQWPASL
jgi:nucleoid-associated protein YgaU